MDLVAPHPLGAARTRRLAAWLFDHRADLLAALVYGCLVYLSFNALADYANAHRLPNGRPLFPHPYGGWALAVAIDGAVLYAFISFKRAPWLAGLLLVSGAATTYTLQRWHAEGHRHPLVVAGVVPGAMILVTFAWHRIRSRPDWVTPTPLGRPVPATPDPDPDPEPERDPGPESDRTRPRVAQDGPDARRPATRGRPAERKRAAQLAAQGHSASRITKELDLSDRARKGWVAELVRSQGHRNGDGP